MFVLCIVLVFQFSCSKDSDLLSDYVLSDTSSVKSIRNVVVNDAYKVSLGGTIILDVLSNDSFENEVEVVITETSTPTNGTVVINSDETLTYIPDDEIVERLMNTTNTTAGDVVDEFTYSIEVVNEDQTVSTGTGTVKIELTRNTTAELLFKSGFEGNVVLGGRTGAYKYFSGLDSETGFTWPASIGGSQVSRVQHIGSIGSISNSRIERVTGHLGEDTQAFYREVNEANGQGTVYQIPHQLTSMTVEDQKFYVSMWMKVDATSFTGNNRYRVIWEYKTYNYDNAPGTGFRVAAYMNMDSNGNEQWVLKGDDGPGNNGTIYWQSSRRDIPFPKDKWFKLEYFVDFVSDGSKTGRVLMKINDEIIADMTNVKTARQGGDPMRTLFLSTVYGANGPIHAWVDDIEIWDNVPY